MKRIFLEFNWLGQKVSKFINYNDMIDEINDVNAHFYFFIINKVCVKIRIFWKDGIIKIYKKDSDVYIDTIDNFNIRYSKKY